MTSIHDLTTLGAVVADAESSRHLRSETVASMLDLGIGWLPVRGQPGLFQMTGGRGGVSSYVIIEPSTSLAVAVLANDSIEVHRDIGRELLAALSPSSRPPFD